ncbi:MAG: O-antigen ligase [Actinomycetota bacterium]|nr:O-antigen ligase [Actinomycetota bacterium]
MTAATGTVIAGPRSRPASPTGVVFLLTALLGSCTVGGADIIMVGYPDQEIAVLAAVLGLVVLAPAVASMRFQARRLDPMHPLFFAAWAFFLPEFVVAAFLILSGQLDSVASWVLQDPTAARIAALRMAIVGSLGLSAGYLLPVGRRIAARLPQPKTFENSTALARPAAVLLLLFGGMGVIWAFRNGGFGYQFNLEIPMFGAMFAFLSQLLVVGQGIVWFSFFRQGRGWWLLALLALGLVLTTVAASGSRGALFSALVLLLACYLYAQDRLWIRRLWKWVIVLLAGLWVGVVFGTSFRWIKIEQLGRSESMSAEEVAAVARKSASEMGSTPLRETVKFGWDRLVERLDGLTSLGVIVANSGALKRDEMALGIDHNIARDFVNSLVPRFLWPDKPTVGIAEQIGGLYYGTEHTSPAVTYMGDLYRNYGWGGVFPGMFLIGLVLRAIYAWLIEGHALTGVRVGIYFITTTAVQYEGLYSTYFPTLFRVLAVGLAGVGAAFVTARLFLGSPPGKQGRDASKGFRPGM